MQIPNLIRNFIRKRIISECILLPFFYPDEGEFESFQEGYRLVGRKTGEGLADDTPGQWRKSWQVIARNALDDPFFVDFALGGASPVYFAYHGAGSWKPIKVADDIVKFEEILTPSPRFKSHARLMRSRRLPICRMNFTASWRTTTRGKMKRARSPNINISAFSSRIWAQTQ